MLRRRDPKLTELAAHPLLSSMRRSQLRTFGARVDVVDLPDGRVLTRQGDVARQFFLLLDGDVDVYIDDEPIVRLRRGSVVGEMGMLATRRTATVRTSGPVRLAVGDRRAFAALLSGPAGIAARIRDFAAARATANALVARPVAA